MADLNDLSIKRTELNTVIANYTQAVQDLAAGTATQQDVDNAKAAAQTVGDEYAKLIAQVKSDDVNVTNDDQLFSNPSRMNVLVRDDIGSIMTTGQFLGGAMKLLVDTEGDASGATNVILSFDTGSNVEIDWGDGSTPQTFTGSASHDYATPGQYEVKVTGTVNGFAFTPVGYRNQLKDVMQWGGVEFASMARMFAYRLDFVISASDKPTLLPGCSFHYTFHNAQDFNSDISHWDVSNVTTMTFTFRDAKAFNQPLNPWDMSGVTDMNQMFCQTTDFNQPLDQWDVSNVTIMEQVFEAAQSFNQDLSMWNVANVVNTYRFNELGVIQSSYLPNFP